VSAAYLPFAYSSSDSKKFIASPFGQVVEAVGDSGEKNI